MSENSHHLQLPYIMPSQAQKHVTHNEALRMLDAVVQLAVESIDKTTPPAMPLEGERHIIDANATGDWTGKENQIAAFVDGAWIIIEPQKGWLAWHSSDNQLLAFCDTGWEAVNGSMDGLPFIGINGTATQEERLVVQTSSILFNHDGDDHRLKLNKAAVGDTASLVFQSGFEGRAEFGLPGNNEFAIKVSADGIQWHDAVRIDETSGEVEFPAVGVVEHGTLYPNLLPDSGRFNSSLNQHLLTDASAVLPGYLSAYNSSVLSLPLQFLHNNDTYGGNRGVLDPVVDELIVKIFGAAGLRYGPEFHVLRIDAGGGSASSITVDGEQYLRQTIMDGNPRPGRYTSGMFVRAESGKIALRNPYGSARQILRDGIPVSYSSSGIVVEPSDGWVYFEVQVTRASLSYDLNDLALCMLLGSVGYMALPRVVAGWVTIGPGIAVLPNGNVFQA